MTVSTTHIRQMLAQAIDACEDAESIQEQLTGDLTAADRERMLSDIQRLLKGAAVNAQHAASEIADEKFRLKYGANGFTRLSS